MNEIEQLLQQKAGLSQDQSHEIAQAIFDIIKSKVPSEFQGALGMALGSGNTNADGQPAAGGGLGSLLGTAEGLFANKG